MSQSIVDKIRESGQPKNIWEINFQIIGLKLITHKLCKTRNLELPITLTLTNFENFVVTGEHGFI